MKNDELWERILDLDAGRIDSRQAKDYVRNQRRGAFNAFFNSLCSGNAHFGKAELERLRRKMLAASYTQHGTDLHELFSRYDRNNDGTLSPEELHSVVQRLLPGIVSDVQLRHLIALMDEDHNGRVDFGEFADFIASRHKHQLRNASTPDDEDSLDIDVAATAARKVTARVARRGRRLAKARLRSKARARRKHHSTHTLSAVRDKLVRQLAACSTLCKC